MPTRLCLAPRCPDEAIYRGYCPVHARQRNRDTSPNKQTYNSKRWRFTRRAKLRANPICERCDATLATEVHHIKDLQDGGDPYSFANLEGLCKQCHSAETKARQYG